jgi:hypothetical protein
MRQASTVARANPPSALVLTDDREQSGPHATVAADIDYHLCALRLYSAPAGSRRGCRGERDRVFDPFLSKHGHGGIDLIAARHRFAARSVGKTVELGLMLAEQDAMTMVNPRLL